MKPAIRIKVFNEESAAISALKSLPVKTPADLATFAALREVLEMRHIFNVRVNDATVIVESAEKTGECQRFFKVCEDSFYLKSPLAAQQVAIEFYARERERQAALCR